MEHAGDRIKENLEYARGQAKDAFGKVFHQESRDKDTEEKAKAQANRGITEGKQQMSSMADEAQAADQQARDNVQAAMSK